MTTDQQQPLTREQLEHLFIQLCSLVPIVANALGKPNPLMNQHERRWAARQAAQAEDTTTGRTSA